MIALAGILAVLVRLAAGVADLNSVRTLRVVSFEPETQFLDRRLNPDLVRNAKVLEIPCADKMVMQLQTAFAVMWVIGR